MPIRYIEENIGGVEVKVGNIGINNTYNSFSKNNTNENASKTEIKSRNEYHGKGQGR